MKKFIYLLFCSVIFLGGCSQKPKSRIESAFEKYVAETYTDHSDFKGIKEIELIDSTDFYELASRTALIGEDATNKIDSIQDVFMYTLSHAPKNKVNSNKVQTLLHEHVDVLSNHKEDIALFRVASTNLKLALDSLSSRNRYNKSYKIKAEFKSSPEYVTFYAQDFAFVDSIKISKDKILVEEMPEEMMNVSRYMSIITNSCEPALEHINRMVEIIEVLQSK
ncbi:MAG: hypothetical protein K2M79_07125 [Muribaculaceae bacterium]|nr:hypothetical protein [Muribaculaceae bacterium]